MHTEILLGMYVDIIHNIVNYVSPIVVQVGEKEPGLKFNL